MPCPTRRPFIYLPATLFWLLGLCLAAVEPAGPALYGRVLDLDLRPLVGVTVRLGSLPRPALTDAAGVFRLSVPDGLERLEVRFERPGYLSESRVLTRSQLAHPLEVVLVPIDLLREEVTVTALNEAERVIDTPFVQNVVRQGTVQSRQPANLAETIDRVPGVSSIGRGGSTATPGIRGLARRRVLLLVDGARVTSDRAAGASVGFLPPHLIQSVEVVRSAAAVLYGSDAIGGVVQVLTHRRPSEERPGGALLFGASSAERRVSLGVQAAHRDGPLTILASLHQSVAGDYRAPGGSVPLSGWGSSAGSLALTVTGADREFEFRFLGARGRDIERPDRFPDPDRAARYPREENNLIDFQYRERFPRSGATLTVTGFVNPSRVDFERWTYSRDRLEESRTTATDTGLRGVYRHPIHPLLTFQFGVDYFGRSGVEIANRTRTGDEIAVERPLADGRRRDLGAFLTLDHGHLAGFDLLSGFRFGHFTHQARRDGQPVRRTDSAPALFVGITRPIGQRLNLFVNVGTAFRRPSLSEAYYSGISGRGRVEGNPDLAGERSRTIDVGIRHFGPTHFVGLYAFQTRLSHLIERVRRSATLYSYANVDSATLRGVEAEWQLFPLPALECFGHGLVYTGRTRSTGARVNDLPPARALIGARYRRGRFWGEAEWVLTRRQDRVGPAEVANAGWHRLDLGAGGRLWPGLQLSARLTNATNHWYYANADPDIPPARGRGLTIGLTALF